MPVVVVFMDDLIIFGYAGFDEHLLDVTEVLRRLQEAGFQVNPEKCIWFASSVNYLSFTILSRNKTEIKHFAGLLSAIPVEQLFAFNADVDFSLNTAFITEHQ
jgi:hypothetical protein